MIVYRTVPIDYWSGWQKPELVFRPFAADERPTHDPEDWEVMWFRALELGRRIGWDGEVRDGPFVTVLPEIPGRNDLAPVVIGWKQPTGGTTFIASPLELPWLAAHCAARIEA